MQHVVRAQAELQRAQEREKDALDRAAVAIQEAARTKQLRLYAWIALAEARRAKDNFKPAYSEFMHLQHLQDHGVCQSVVQKVLSCGFWSTLRYSLVHRTSGRNDWLPREKTKRHKRLTLQIRSIGLHSLSCLSEFRLIR